MDEQQKQNLPAKKKGGLVKIIVAVLVIAVVVFIANRFGWTEKLQDVRAMQVWFRELGILGWGVFIVLFIAVAVFMIPGSVLTIIGGIAFGSVLGGVLSLIGATLGASVAFIVARYVARDAIVGKFQNNPIFSKIENGVKENGTSFLILTRLVPVFPYNVQNYIYGLTPIKLGTFFFVSLITMAPGAFIFAYMAGKIVEEGFSVWLLVQFAAAGVILFLVSLIPKYIAKKRGIKLDSK